MMIKEVAVVADEVIDAKGLVCKVLAKSKFRPIRERRRYLDRMGLGKAGIQPAIYAICEIGLER